MGYQRNPDGVTLTLSEDDFHLLILTLGFAVTCASQAERREGLKPERILHLANSINDGNPKWTPYLIAPEKPR